MGVPVWSQGQGLIIFNNRVTPEVNARVTFQDGTPVGAGFTAQLYGGPAGTPVDGLTPLLPTTTFRLSSPAALGYVQQVEVPVPGVPRFGDATVQMRVYNGASWETSLIRGESDLIVVRTASETSPPANLVGLQPFQCSPSPNPARPRYSWAERWACSGRVGAAAHEAFGSSSSG